MKTSLLFVLVAVLFQTQHAAETIHLSLDDAIRLSIQRGTQAQLAEAAEERARGLADEARAAMLPQVNGRLLRYSESINLETFGFAVPGQPPVVGPFNVTDAQLTAAQRLFDLASLRRYQAVRQGAQASRFAVERTENDVAAATARIYVVLQQAEANVKSREANVKLFQQISESAKRQFDQGVVTRLDVSRANLQLANEKQALLVSQNQRETARIALLRAIGANQSANVVTEPFLDRDAPIPPLDGALGAAREKRPELKEFAAREAQARHALQSTRAQHVPTVAAQFSGDMSGNRVDDLHWSRRIGAALDVPIFDGGRIEAQVAQAKGTLHEAEIRRADASAGVEEDVRHAVMNAENANARAAVAREAVAVAEDELNVAHDRYVNGVGSSLELDRAEDAYRQALENRIAAESDVALAIVDLQHATGDIRSHFATSGDSEQ